MERKGKRYVEDERRISARILGDRFIQRWDIHALQLPEGNYICVRKPISHQDLRRHVQGELTLGAYVLDTNSETTYTVLDADSDVSHHQLFKLADALAEMKIPSYMESSRRGGHLWFFFSEKISGMDAKRFGESLLAHHNIKDIEVFPKQESAGKQRPGSLVRLPFGKHQKSGKVYPFVNIEDGLPIAESVHAQLLKLWNPETVSKAGFEKFSIFSSEKSGRIMSRGPLTEPRDNIWNRIRQSTPAIDFIGRYIELTPTETGGVGYCPFHEDSKKSFGVHRTGNYWRCFAGCGGGSIIDFWMRWKNVEMGEAVHELKGMLEVE